MYRSASSFQKSSHASLSAVLAERQKEARDHRGAPHYHRQKLRKAGPVSTFSKLEAAQAAQALKDLRADVGAARARRKRLPIAPTGASSIKQAFP